MNMDGNSLYGNWESGIKIIDNARLGLPSSDVVVPKNLANNKAKNHGFSPINTWLNWHVFSF